VGISLAPKDYLVPVHKWPFYPNFSLLSEFNPRNINYMPVVKFIERLDLEQNISFMDRRYLVSIRKRCFCPNPSLCEKSYPRNIKHIPAENFFYTP